MIGSPRSTCYVPARSPSPSVLRTIDLSRHRRERCTIRRMTHRIAIGGFLHESHSFAPRPTTYADFVQPGGFPPLQNGTGLFDAVRTTSVPAAGAIAVAEAAGVDARAARLELRQSRRPGAGRSVRAHRGADLRPAVRRAGCGAAGWRVSRPAWRRGGRKLPRCRGRTAAPRARHRGRSAADHQPRSARQPDARRWWRWPMPWCRSAPTRMST